MKILAVLLVFFTTLSAEENFLLIDQNHVVLEKGSSLHDRVPPACSFNIFLSLVGFEEGVLHDENNPVWDYQEGYPGSYDTWRQSQTPLSWMRVSAYWYSQLIAQELGKDKIESYLNLFNYGNQDLSGGHTSAWVNSSLRISPWEQAQFVQNIFKGSFPISSHALEKTKLLLFKEEMSNGWKIYGKTGLSSFIHKSGEKMQVGWLVGFIEKQGRVLSFAYNIQEPKINDQRLARVKELILSSDLN